MRVLALASAVLVVILWPALVGTDILGFRDMLHNYGPMRELFWRGTIALWNDRAFGGGPVLGDIVQQPFYLGNLVMRAIHAPAWPGIPIRLCLHVLGGMAATWALLRRTTSDEAAGIGAAAFGLCGFTIANFSDPQWACAATWAPAVFFAFDLWGGKGGLATNALLALALPEVLLAGDPQLFLLVAIAGAFYAFVRRQRPARDLVRDGIGVAIVAFAVAAPQVVSSLRALPTLARSEGLPRSVREQWSLHPIRVAELFVPRMFGPLFSERFWGHFTVSPPWNRNYVHSIYAGAIGPALVWAAVWKRRRDSLPWVAIAVFAILLSLGPVYGAVTEVVPLLRVFRYPQRIVALLVPAWAALLAIGAGEIVRLPRRQRALLTSFAVALGFAALGLASLFATPDHAALLRTSLQLVLVGAASAAALMLPQRFAVVSLAAVLAVDLAAANRELFGFMPRRPLLSPPDACEAIDDASGNARRDKFRVFSDSDALGSSETATGWVAERIREYNYGKRNVLELCGFREAVAVTSLIPKAETQLWHDVSPLRYLQVMSVRFVITAPGKAAEFGGREVSVDPKWGFAVVELDKRAPMLFRPEQVEQVPSGRLLAEARARPDLLGEKMVAIDAPLRPHLPDPSARLVSWRTLGDRVTFRVRQSEPGYWVYAATLDRDWVARLDEELAAIDRSDLVRRAVWVPAGDHTVTLDYEPSLLLWLFAISVAVQVALATAALQNRRHANADPLGGPART